MKIILKYYLLIFIILTSCHHNEKAVSSNNQPDSTIPDLIIADSTIYEVINYVLSHKELNTIIKSNYLLNKEGMPFLFALKNDSLELTQMDSILSKADIKYIFSQKKQYEKFTVNPKYIRSKDIIPYDSLNNYKSYCTISFPLFNIKKDIAIIRTTYYCGTLCSLTGTYIYQRRNSNWVLLKVLKETTS